MSTNENEILEAHRKRMELRERLSKVVGDCMDDHVDMDDVMAELNLVHMQLSGFIATQAHEKSKEKEQT